MPGRISHIHSETSNFSGATVGAMTTWSDPIATRSIVRLQVADSRSARRFDEGQLLIGSRFSDGPTVLRANRFCT